MERNLFPTWTEWLPRDGGEWNEAEFAVGRSAMYKIRFDVLRNGKPVEVRLRPLPVGVLIGCFAATRCLRPASMPISPARSG